MEHNHDCSHSHEHGHEHEDAHDKYMEALAKYNTHLNDEDVKAKVTHFIEEHLAENNTPEVKKFLFHCIDLTTLKMYRLGRKRNEISEKVTISLTISRFEQCSRHLCLPQYGRDSKRHTGSR